MLQKHPFAVLKLLPNSALRKDTLPLSPDSIEGAEHARAQAKPQSMVGIASTQQHAMIVEEDEFNEFPVSAEELEAFEEARSVPRQQPQVLGRQRG